MRWDFERERRGVEETGSLSAGGGSATYCTDTDSKQVNLPVGSKYSSLSVWRKYGDGGELSKCNM